MFIYYFNYVQSRCDRSEMNKHIGVYFLKGIHFELCNFKELHTGQHLK